MKRISISFPLLLLCITWALPSLAQTEAERWQFSANLTQNSASLGNPLSGPLHPGITLAAARAWKDTDHSQLYQSFRLGYLYHQYIQHAVQLTTELGYKYKFSSGIGFAPVIGGGYVHSIATENQFKLQDDGTYKQVPRLGRPNWLITLGANFGYSLAKVSSLNAAIFLSYRFSVQGVFIRSTSPILAYSTVGIGVAVPLKKRS